MSFERNAPKINIKSPLTVLIFKVLQSFKKTVSFGEYIRSIATFVLNRSSFLIGVSFSFGVIPIGVALMIMSYPIGFILLMSTMLMLFFILVKFFKISFALEIEAFLTATVRLQPLFKQIKATTFPAPPRPSSRALPLSLTSKWLKDFKKP